MRKRIRTRKRNYGCPRTLGMKAAQTYSISMYPRHLAMLGQRAKELNVSRSVAMQLLCEIEERDCLLRAELLKRLEAGPIKQLTAIA
jgi:hypothetical protein